ncbi:uncharacterized protein SCHCODRAFT_02638836 [Schizophyllum commune H4-8]|nr:uncharacterized protein SCHCODRAFT_02638836 [Schizophyllum commune H4-8]KAI5887728.1 hypothetical protein SCHCODRAFT_02638836 [Schizophyllum commune H4-8]
MKYSAWLADARQIHSYEPVALDALSSYLNYEVSSHDAAKSIVAAEARVPPLQGGLIWGGLLSLAANDPEVHEQLVDLIKAIMSLPNKPQYPLGTAWRDTHDSIWSETIDFKNVRKIDRHNPDPLIKRWPAYHALTARLMAASLLDAHYIALTQIVHALETHLAYPPTPYQAMNIAAAAQYFILCPVEVYLNPLRTKHQDDPGYGWKWGEDMELWKGKLGWSAERWAFWKRRWAEVREMEALSELAGLGDDVRELARRAEVGMDKVERAVAKKGETKVRREGV